MMNNVSELGTQQRKQEKHHSQREIIRNKVKPADQKGIGKKKYVSTDIKLHPGQDIELGG